jgi:predicted dehydrogenase
MAEHQKPSPPRPGFGIGLVGYGGIGKFHTANWRNLNLYYPDLPRVIELRGAASRSQASAELAVSEGGYGYGTVRYQDLLDDPGIDLIDICTPNDTHYEITLAALEAGKHVYCEKPLALDLDQAREMVQRAEASDRVLQLAFNYRFIPAVMKAKALIDEGFLGEVVTFHARYFHTGYLDPERPLSWRLDLERSGGGALVDLGSHLIDLMLYLAGPFQRLLAQTRTFVKERPVAAGAAEKAAVKVDDHAQLLIDLQAGGLGIIEVSRVAQGSADDLNFEILGTQGALKFDVMDPSWLYAYDAREPKVPLGGRHGFKAIQTLHEYPGNRIPGGRSLVNALDMHANSQYQVVLAALGLQPAMPDARQGYEVQQVLEASYLSAAEGRWVTLPIQD